MLTQRLVYYYSQTFRRKPNMAAPVWLSITLPKRIERSDIKSCLHHSPFYSSQHPPQPPSLPHPIPRQDIQRPTNPHPHHIHPTPCLRQHNRIIEDIHIVIHDPTGHEPDAQFVQRQSRHAGHVRGDDAGGEEAQVLEAVTLGAFLGGEGGLWLALRALG